MVQVPPDDRRPGLSPPQFGLGTLMGLIALLGVMFSIMTSVGPYGVFAVILIVLAVLAHVAANALGTRLRENGSRPVPPDDGGATEGSPRSQRRPPVEGHFAPSTRLRERYTKVSSKDT